MTKQKTLQLGKSTIVLTDHHGDFSDGHSNGYLYYYDERHRLSFPLTSDTLVTFIATNMTDPRQSQSWNGGFVAGWMEALFENHPETFRSLVPEDGQERHTDQLRLTVLYEV
jgi:hypothetical protein